MQDDWYFLSINPSSEFNCTSLNDASAYLYSIGLLTIVFAILYFTFHFTNGHYQKIKQLYSIIKDERSRSKTKKSFFILTALDVLWRVWGPVAIVGTMRSLGVLFATNSLIAIYVLFKSGCF